MSVATMNIKDPAIHAAAQRLARVRGISMTEAVRQAIDEALAADAAKREGMAARILAIGREARATMDRLGLEPLSDADLYDEIGAPR
jgi:antitoxin VapB